MKINTRTLMIASALFMAGIGLAFTFAPDEISNAVGGGDAFGCQLVIMQLCGALYCGFALMNWMAKGATLGGIYGRPIVMGNLVHFTMGALLLLKLPLHHSSVPGELDDDSDLCVVRCTIRVRDLHAAQRQQAKLMSVPQYPGGPSSL